MAAQWPADFPDPEVNGWGLSPAPLTVRSDMEAGAARVRRVSTQRNDTVQASWVFTIAQFAEFRTWFESETGAKHGVEWITMRVQAGQSPECARDDNVRFIGAWQAGAVTARHVRVQATLEVRN